MLKYLFIFTVKDQNVLLETPKENSKVFKPQLPNVVKNIVAKNLKPLERYNTIVEPDYKIYAQRRDDSFYYGVIIQGDFSRISMVYKLFDDIHKQARNHDSDYKQKEVEDFVVKGVKEFQTTLDNDPTNKLKQKTSEATKKVQKMVETTQVTHIKLENITSETQAINTEAAEINRDASSLHSLTYWMDQKMNMIIYGGIAILFIIFGSWLFIVLKSVEPL